MAPKKFVKITGEKGRNIAQNLVLVNNSNWASGIGEKLGGITETQLMTLTAGI